MFVGARASFRPSSAVVLALLLLPTLTGALLAAPKAKAHGGVEPRDWETRVLADANDDYPLTNGDIDLLTLDIGELFVYGFRDYMLLVRVGTRYEWNESQSQRLGINLSLTIDGQAVSAIATTDDGRNWTYDDRLFETVVYADSRGDRAIYFLQTFRRLGLRIGDEIGDLVVRGFRVANNTTLAGDRMPGFTVAPGNEQFADEPLGWPKELPELDRPANESVERWNPNNTTELDAHSGASYTIGTYVLRGAVSFFDVTVNRTEAEVARTGFADFTVRVRNRLDFPYALLFRLGDVVGDHDWRVRYQTPTLQLLPGDGAIEYRFQLSPLALGDPASRLRAPFTILSNSGGTGSGEVFVRLVGVPRFDPRETHIEFLDLGVPPPANDYTLVTFRITNETGAPLAGMTNVRMSVQRTGFSTAPQYRLPEKDPGSTGDFVNSYPGLYETVFVFHDPGTYRLKVTVMDFDARPSREFLIDVGKIPLAEGLDLPGFEGAVALLALAVLALVARRRRNA